MKPLLLVKTKKSLTSTTTKTWIPLSSSEAPKPKVMEFQASAMVKIPILEETKVKEVVVAEATLLKMTRNDCLKPLKTMRMMALKLCPSKEVGRLQTRREMITNTNDSKEIPIRIDLNKDILETDTEINLRIEISNFIIVRMILEVELGKNAITSL